MATKAKTPPNSVYQLKITLSGSKPPIWRRVQVDSHIKLSKLHDIFQEVMGWEDSHLHQFVINKERYGEPYDDDFGMYKIQDEKKYWLDQLITAPKTKFIYGYDFGDGWEHIVSLEKIVEPDAAAHYPVCTGGARACPPEDCGGIWGYEEMLETLNSDSEDKAELIEWLGGDFVPELFDIERLNWRLKKLK